MIARYTGIVLTLGFLSIVPTIICAEAKFDDLCSRFRNLTIISGTAPVAEQPIQAKRPRLKDIVACTMRARKILVQELCQVHEAQRDFIRTGDEKAYRDALNCWGDSLQLEDSTTVAAFSNIMRSTPLLEIFRNAVIDPFFNDASKLATLAGNHELGQVRKNRIHALYLEAITGQPGFEEEDYATYFPTSIVIILQHVMHINSSTLYQKIAEEFDEFSAELALVFEKSLLGKASYKANLDYRLDFLERVLCSILKDFVHHDDTHEIIEANCGKFRIALSQASGLLKELLAL